MEMNTRPGIMIETRFKLILPWVFLVYGRFYFTALMYQYPLARQVYRPPGSVDTIVSDEGSVYGMAANPVEKCVGCTEHGL